MDSTLILLFVAGIVAGLVTGFAIFVTVKLATKPRLEIIPESWEHDSVTTMNRYIFKQGVLTEVRTVEEIQDTPHMRPWKTHQGWGDPKHKPKAFNSLDY